MSLPTEIWVEIVSWLNRSDLARVAAVCRRLRDICYSDYVWQSVFRSTMLAGPVAQRRMVPNYVTRGKNITMRTKYIRILYWFLHDERLEQTGCIPNSWKGRK